MGHLDLPTLEEAPADKSRACLPKLQRRQDRVMTVMMQNKRASTR